MNVYVNKLSIVTWYQIILIISSTNRMANSFTPISILWNRNQSVQITIYLLFCIIKNNPSIEVIYSTASNPRTQARHNSIAILIQKFDPVLCLEYDCEHIEQAPHSIKLNNPMKWLVKLTKTIRARTHEISRVLFDIFCGFSSWHSLPISVILFVSRIGRTVNLFTEIDMVICGSSDILTKLW